MAWSVGYYTVEGGENIYGLICAPTTGGPYPVVIYNHGGRRHDGGNVTGVVTASGWTARPRAPDGLGQCVDWANAAGCSPRPPIAARMRTSPRRTRRLRRRLGLPTATWNLPGRGDRRAGAHRSSIACRQHRCRRPGETVSPNVSNKLLMYGYSHGGCITWRAVDRRAGHRLCRHRRLHRHAIDLSDRVHPAPA